MKRQLLAVALYLFIISISANYFEFDPMREWWINTFVLLIFCGIFIFTSTKQYNILVNLILLLVVWVAHIILTIPASYCLGILMKDPDHIRTIAEHRSVFLLASLPIFTYLMNSSTIFNRGKNE